MEFNSFIRIFQIYVKPKNILFLFYFYFGIFKFLFEMETLN